MTDSNTAYYNSALQFTPRINDACETRWQFNTHIIRYGKGQAFSVIVRHPAQFKDYADVERFRNVVGRKIDAKVAQLEENYTVWCIDSDGHDTYRQAVNRVRTVHGTISY